MLYFVDIFQGEKQIDMTHLLLDLESEEEINRIYKTLSENGSVKFELQKTFWGAYHAVVTDCYGNTWGLNYSVNR